MDVFKSSAANLYAAYVPQVEALVYCTSLEILKQAVKDCGFSHYRPNKVLPGNLIRHNAITGTGKVMQKFSETTYSSYGKWDNWAEEGAYGYNERGGYSRRHMVTQGASASTASPVTVTAIPASVEKSATGGTVIDASTAGRGYSGKTYASFEEYQAEKYGPPEGSSSEKEAAEANELIVKEELDKQSTQVLMSGVPIPDYIKGLKEPKFREAATDDWLEIHSRYVDFRTQHVKKYVNKQQA